MYIDGLSSRERALIRALIWRMYSCGAAPPAIAAQVNAEFGNGREIVTAESVGNWLLSEVQRRAAPLEIPPEPRTLSDGALITLEAELTIARARFDKLPEQGGRQGASLALEVVCDFIDRFGPMRGAELSRPLRALLVALAELARGETLPLLQPTPRSRGKPRAQARGRVALVNMAVASMEAAMDEGMSRDAASRAVAKELIHAGVELPGNSIAAAARYIAGLRDEAGVGEGGHHPGAARLLSDLRKQKVAGGVVRRGEWKRVIRHVIGKHGRVLGIPSRIPGKG
jgi:hypothetical protein